MSPKNGAVPLACFVLGGGGGVVISYGPNTARSESA